MSSNLRAHLGLLQYLSKVKNNEAKKRLLFLLGEDVGVFNAVKEILVNTTKGRLKLTPQKKAIIQRSAKAVLQITKHKTPTNKSVRKKRLVQVGGFLPFLIPLLASVLIDVVRK